MFIQEADLFKETSQVFMNELSKLMIKESFGAGTFLLQEGEQTTNFYVLEEGRVRLSIGERGHIVYTVSNPGGAFGWSSLVGLEAYTATAECVVDSRLIKIDKDDLIKLFNKYPADGMLFYRHLAGLVGQRLVNSYGSILTTQKEEVEPSYG